MSYAINLKLYGENDEVEAEYNRSFVPFRLLKKASQMMKTIQNFGDDMENISEDAIDQLADFVVEFFGNKFSRDDLMDKADMGEIMAVVTAITMKMSGTSPNPTPPQS
ncbi:MAG: hypothetical protein KBA03_00735 [Anaerolineaceae bacterium]|nr:hypothetical protein [Anaerolineaceae bacterium]